MEYFRYAYVRRVKARLSNLLPCFDFYFLVVPPSKALINKRKQCKPVETSEKEAEDKKRTKEDEEVATTTVVCTSDELVRN